MKDPIHQDDVIRILKEAGYTAFIDEQSRVINLDLFPELFVYKYGGFLSNWSIFLHDDTLSLRNISRFTYRFPLYKTSRL